MGNRMRKRLGWVTAVLFVLASLLPGGPAFAQGEASGFELRLTASVEGSAAQEVNSRLADSYLLFAGDTAAKEPVINIRARFAGMDFFRLFLKLRPQEGTLLVGMPEADARSTYSISEERISSLLEEAFAQVNGEGQGSLSELLKGGPQLAPEEYEEALQPYLSLLNEEIFSKGSTQEDVPVTLERLGRTAEHASLYSCEPSTSDTALLFLKTADLLEKDEKLGALVKEWARYLRSVSDLVTFTLPQTGTGESGAVWQEMDGAEAADVLEQGFAQLPETLRNAAAELLTSEVEGPILRFRYAQEMDGARPVLAELKLAPEYESSVAAGMENLWEETGTDTCLYLSGMDGSDLSLTNRFRSGNRTNTGTLQLDLGAQNLGVITYSLDQNRKSMLGIPYGTCVFRFEDVNATLLVSDAAQGGEGASRHMLRIIVPGTENTGVDALTFDLVSRPQAEVEEPTGQEIDVTGYSLEQLGDLAAKLAGQYGQYLQTLGNPFE